MIDDAPRSFEGSFDVSNLDRDGNAVITDDDLLRVVSGALMTTALEDMASVAAFFNVLAAAKDEQRRRDTARAP